MELIWTRRILRRKPERESSETQKAGFSLSLSLSQSLSSLWNRKQGNGNTHSCFCGSSKPVSLAGRYNNHTAPLLHSTPLHSNEPWYIPNNKQAWELSEADESAINPAALVFGCVRTCKWRFIQLFNYWPQICTAYTMGNLLALFSLFSIETWSHYCMLYIGGYFDDFIVAFFKLKIKALNEFGASAGKQYI